MTTILYEIHLFNDTFSKHETYLYRTERRGKRARQWRDRERVCVRDGEGQGEEVVAVVKMAAEENGIVGIRI